MRTIILGGTGFIGRALARLLLHQGHEVVVPSRRPDRVPAVLGQGILAAPFDGVSGAGWAGLLTPGTAIVNLAGENIADGRWTPDKKRRILESRMEAGAAVMDAISRAGVLPAALVQASAVGYYGARGPESVSEDAPAGGNFLAQVARRWEDSTRAAEDLGVRRVVVRTGMVLGPGGALAKMLPVFRLGLGGPLGAGTQMLPWIHLDDEAGAIAFLLRSPGLAGPFNLAAPEAVDSRGFARALGRALGRPALLPAPGLALKLLLGQMAEEVLLSGARAEPDKLLAAGYRFRHPSLAGALADALGRT
ncbi:MAG: TIGR01777 family oxidoreductase [Proteobacteria bacterium]|nr:TIGR01777 family oxidoreductase [Pseudomonadota bacterium]MBU1593993.1 TIGR01777 family oxidoreductase [Pseudomonadota bacterium]